MAQNGAGAFLISWKVLSLDFSGNVFFLNTILAIVLQKPLECEILDLEL